jgi:hypothetical protein
MLRRTWFSRCWIVREICSAEAVIALCGNTIIDWGELITFSIWINVKGLALREYFGLRAVPLLSTTMLPYRLAACRELETLRSMISNDFEFKSVAEIIKA